MLKGIPELLSRRGEVLRIRGQAVSELWHGHAPQSGQCIDGLVEIMVATV